MNKTKVAIGLLDPVFTPIASEPDDVMPVYEPEAKALSLGHAVRAALSIQTAELRVYGDDALQISDDLFLSGSLEMETLLDDLALEAALYGGTYDAESGLTTSSDDASVPGAVSFVRKMMKKDKSLVYRACVLFRCQANRSNYTIDSATKQGTLEPKNGRVNFDVFESSIGAWKWEQDYDSEAAALQGIASLLHSTT